MKIVTHLRYWCGIILAAFLAFATHTFMMKAEYQRGLKDGRGAQATECTINAIEQKEVVENEIPVIATDVANKREEALKNLTCSEFYAIAIPTGCLLD